MAGQAEPYRRDGSFRPMPAIPEAGAVAPNPWDHSENRVDGAAEDMPI